MVLMEYGKLDCFFRHGHGLSSFSFFVMVFYYAWQNIPNRSLRILGREQDLKCTPRGGKARVQSAESG